MNKRQIEAVVKKLFFTENSLPTAEEFSGIIGAENYNNYLTSANKVDFLNKLGREFEVNLESTHKEIFCYVMALKGISDKVPRDYVSLIRILKKKSMLNTNLNEWLETAYARRNALFVDKNITTEDTFLKLVNQFETRREILLGERLDLAYNVYKQANAEIANGNHSEAVSTFKQRSQEFMATVLNVNSIQEIESAMAERAKKWRFDPDFIPNRKPKNLTKLPAPHEADNRAAFDWRRLSEAALALKRNDITIVREEGLKSDKETNTIFLKPHEHEKFQVVIKDGLFYEREADNTFTKCDTSLRLSHMKLDYAAIVVNLRGEVLLFDHLDQLDRYAHSSMNAQAAILCSGEVKIKDGRLDVLTSHSGHYLPDEQNIYRLLKYFKEQGVDISEVTVVLWKPDHGEQAEASVNDVVTEKLYYNAEELFEKWEASDKENIIPYQKATTNQILSMLDTDPNIKAEKKAKVAASEPKPTNDTIYTNLFQKPKSAPETLTPKDETAKNSPRKKS